MTPVKEVLLIADNMTPAELESAARQYADLPVAVLSFDLALEGRRLPDKWRALKVADFLDIEQLRRDFFEFIRRWPRVPLMGDATFDDMFRRPDGYSVWWTGPGMERDPDQRPFRSLSVIWTSCRALRQLRPRRVLISVGRPDLAWALASGCRNAGCPHEFILDSARDDWVPWERQFLWAVKAIFRLLRYPLLAAARAVAYRWLVRISRETREQLRQPAVIVASPFLNTYHVHDGRMEHYYWRELEDALAAADPGVRRRHIVTFIGDTKHSWSYKGVFHTGWRLLHTLDGAVSSRERYPALLAGLRSLPYQLASLWRYCRLERTERFRNSFEFAGANVASCYVPRLRGTIVRLAHWAQSVGAIVQCYRAVGNVKAVLVDNEMYEFGMLRVAAARRLGIPTIGVQHGTIFPMHLIYTLPPEHIAGAPVPDYFAVYGDYAKDVVSVDGSFPPERVWVTGGSRFDHLVREPARRDAARRHLHLPEDRRVLLLATQNYVWFQDAARALLRVVKGRDDLLLCIKTHPADVPMETYRRLAAEAGVENVRFFDSDFELLMAACDVVVSGSSTTLLEAIIFGRRAICVNFSDAPDRYPYVADGGALGARSSAELDDAVRTALSPAAQDGLERRRQCFLARHAGPAARGQAAEMFARKIIEIVSAPGNIGGNRD